MSLPSLIRRISCFLLLALASLFAKAASLQLPPTAIAEDTFLIATIDLTNLDPAMLEATAKTALGEKATDVDELLAATSGGRGLNLFRLNLLSATDRHLPGGGHRRGSFLVTPRLCGFQLDANC